MCIHYFINTSATGEWVYAPWLRGLLFLYPSECRMLIPGTYAQMHEDYE